MNRRVVAATILAAWFGALGWLFARRLEPVDGPDALRRLGPGSAWYQYEVGGIPIGSVGLTIDTLATGFTLLSVVGLDGAGATQVEGRQALRSEATLSRGFRLQVARATASEAGAPLVVEAAATTDSLVTIRQAIPGEPQRPIERLPVATPVHADAATFRLGAEQRLTTGAIVGLRVFDPVRGTTDSLAGRVTRDSLFVVADSATVDTTTGVWTPVATDTVRAWRVEIGTPVREVRWVTDQGWPLLIEHGFGATLRRAAFEIVENDYNRRRQAGEFVRLALAPGLTPYRAEAGPRPRTGPHGVVLTRRDGRPVPGGAALLAGGRQSARGDTLVIGADFEDPRDGPLPHHRNTIGAFTGAERAMLSRALSLVLQDVGTTGDTVGALTRWVAREVHKDFSVSAPVSAGDVLRVGRAGAEGKARLTVAMARLAGYPARVVSGLVLADPVLPAHTWVEVWTGRWVAVDPTYGQVPASTELLRVMEGPARAVAMLTAVGALRVTPVDSSGLRP